MAGAREQSKPTFLWQAILILLPVVVLASIGWMSLRNDKRLARHEAAARAQALADELVPLLWDELTAKRNATRIAFKMDGAGRLLFPPAHAPLPVPSPFDLKQLKAEQLRLWNAAQNTSDDPGVLAGARQVCDDFLNSNPPGNLAAAVCYGTGLLFLRQQRFPEAAEMFGRILDTYPNSVGESGVPFVALARFKLLQLGPHETPTPNWMIQTSGPRKLPHNVSGEPDFPAVPLKHVVPLDSFCSNIVNSPSALTPRFLALLQERIDEEDAILAKGGNEPGFGLSIKERSKTAEFKEDRAALRKWQRTWDEHEWLRQIYSAARPSFRSNVLLLPSTEQARAKESSNAAYPSLSNVNGRSTNNLTAHLFWFTTPLLTSHVFWFNSPDPATALQDIQTDAHVVDRGWLAVRFDENPDSSWILCRDEFEMRTWLRSWIKSTRHFPDYFGVTVEMAGRKVGAPETDIQPWHYVQRPGGKGGGGFNKVPDGGDRSSLLASAAQFENGIEQLKVSVYLTSSSALFQNQRSRAIWFGSLMAASIGAALTGLFMAHRAFRRQLRLNEMKSNFVSSVSHELRAPIASVRLLAESLERGRIQEPEKQHEYFRFIVQECRRLSSLIENVLDFSRIEQGRKQYEFEPTNLSALGQRTVGLMKTYAAEHNVRLEATFLDDTVSAVVDGKAIQQALVNLIDNAVKHSPHDSPVCVGLASDANSVQLWVEDHGEGIPVSEQEKIFERFYRLGSELRRETPGVGIGLSIVKHIVEAHGGRVVVRSAPGEGSRFTIEIPIHPETSNNDP